MNVFLHTKEMLSYTLRIQKEMSLLASLMVFLAVAYERKRICGRRSSPTEK